VVREDLSAYPSDVLKQVVVQHSLWLLPPVSAQSLLTHIYLQTGLDQEGSCMFLMKVTFQQQIGIYTDVSICESGSAIRALQYSCTRSEQQNNGKELLNKLEEAVEQQNMDNEEDIEEDIPLGDPQIPDDIHQLFENVGTVEEIQSLIKNTGDKSKLISMLEEYLHDLKEEASSNNAKSTRNQKEELEKSDAQLVSQLEQALSHI